MPQLSYLKKVDVVFSTKSFHKFNILGFITVVSQDTQMGLTPVETKEKVLEVLNISKYGMVIT